MSNTVNPGTFTRATEATYEDHEGLVRTAKSGQARMVGSRVVENLITASEDMTNAAYAIENAAVVDSATQATFDGTTDGTVKQTVTITDDGSGAGGRTFVFSVNVRLVSGTISGDSALKIRIAGDAITNSDQNIGSSVTSTAQRFSVTASTDAAGTFVVPRVMWDDAGVLEITKWQLEEVTGQTNQNPSEYVSTGVGTGPELYTVANALEGGTDATTGLSQGFLDSGANVFESQQSVVPSGFSNAIHANSNDTPTQDARFYEDLDDAYSPADGKDYVIGFWIRHVGTGSNWDVRLGSSTTGSTVLLNLANTETTWAYYTFTFTHGSDTQYLVVREATGSNDGGVYITGLTIKEADHGLNRDGVKAFSTLNGNTVSNGVVTEATGPAVNQQWVEFDGASGTYVSAPDNAAASVTGDITLIWNGALDDWTPADNNTLAGKFVSSGNQRAYLLDVEPAGSLRFIYYPDGATARSASSGAAVPFANGEGGWLRLTYNSTTGDVTFFASHEPLGTALSALNWVQLGATQSVTAGSIYDSTAAVEVGSIDGGISNLASGAISRAVVIDSTDPTADPVVDFNANDYYAGVTWETQSQKNTTNLVTNGSAFEDTTGWTEGDAGTAISVSDSKLVLTNGDGTAAYVSEDFAPTAGKTYLVSVDLVTKTATGSQRILFGGNDTGSTLSAGTHVYTWTASNSNQLTLSNGDNGTVSNFSEWDNISIIELPDVWTLNGNAKVVSPMAKWGDLPGASGDYFSTPDSAAADIINDIAVTAYVALDDWNPSSPETFISKWLPTGGQRSYAFSVDTDGTLEGAITTNGSTNIVVNSTVSTGFANGTGHWVLFVREQSSGNAYFYTSEDSPWTPYNQISWTQLGDAIPMSTGDIHSGTALVTVSGSNLGGFAVVNGKIMRAAVIASTDPAVAPSVDFDARTFTPGVSTATAPTGEVWTANGNVSIEQNIPSNWDSDGPLGYLAEESRTNAQVYSQEFDNAVYTKQQVSVTTNAIRAPDGTLTGQKMVEDSSLNTHRLFDIPSNSAGTDYAVSVFAKAGERTELRIDWNGRSTVTFDLAAGEILSVSGSDTTGVGSIHPVGDGWYRCKAVLNIATTGQGLILGMQDSGNASYQGDGSSGLYIWGFQFETGSFPTSYIPTTTTSVTRNADALTYSATGVADSFPMTMSAEFTVKGDTTPTADAYVLTPNDGATGDDHTGLYLDTTGVMQFSSESGNVNQGFLSSDTGVILGVTQSITGVNASNDLELYLDGRSNDTDVLATPPVAANIDNLDIGKSRISANYLNGTIRKVKIFRKRLDDSLIKNL